MFTPSVASITEDYEKQQAKLKNAYREDVKTVVEVQTKKSKDYELGISELQTAKSESDAETKKAEAILKNLR
ncbi:MAG: hypothetical protein AAFN81_10840 [Bacteroidota bacterium]